MDTIRQWMLCLLVSAIVGTMVFLLSPKGAVQKALRTVIALFVLLSIFLPFAQLDLNSVSLEMQEEPGSRQAQQLEGAVYEQIHASTTALVEQLTQEVLDARGVQWGQIVVNTDIREDNSILMAQVEVQLLQPNTEIAQILKTELEEETGMPVEVVVVS